MTTYIPSALCLGSYPKWAAYALRWIVNHNSKRTVMLTFKGRSPKKGEHFGWGGTLKLSQARRVAVYVKVNPSTPVNRAHIRAHAKQQANVAAYIASKKEAKQ